MTAELGGECWQKDRVGVAMASGVGRPTRQVDAARRRIAL
jgi:hypothetical protein